MKNIAGEKKKFDYKWVIVVLSFLMVMICLGFCSSPKSLFIAPITQAIGINRSLFSINDSVRFITTAVINVFFGTLINRFGMKKLVGAGIICLILSQLVYSFATNIFVFCIGGVLLGLGLSWTTTTMVGAIINKWCRESKGTIMGAVLAANGIGGATAIQIITPVIESGVYGYRNAYRLIAVALSVLFVFIMIFFKNNPEKEEEDGAVKVSVKKKKSKSHEWSGIEYRNAVKMPYFYCALICIFLTGLALQSVSGVAAAHMLSEGKKYTEIADETGLSTATISRVNRCLKYGSDGYAVVFERLKKKHEND